MSNSKIKEIENVENIKFYKEFIESKIYDIRGQKAMLDFELAEIYNYSTKNFNRQINNNINKFPNDFRFQLSKEEVDEISRCKNCTSIMRTTGTKGGRSYLPYAFIDAGNRITIVTKIEDKNVYHSMIDSLLLNQNYNI